MRDKVIRWIKQYPGHEIALEYIDAKERESQKQAELLADAVALKEDAYESLDIAKRALITGKADRETLVAEKDALAEMAKKAQGAIAARYDDIGKLERKLGELTGAYDRVVSECTDLKMDVSRLEGELSAKACRVNHLSKVIEDIKAFIGRTC